MPSTTKCNSGDVVVVPFMFSDRPVTKRRPCVVVSSERYHDGRQETIVAAVTSNVDRRLLTGDHLLQDWQAAGLPKPSVVTGILRTVKQPMIIRKLGGLTGRDRLAVSRALSDALDL